MNWTDFVHFFKKLFLCFYFKKKSFYVHWASLLLRKVLEKNKIFQVTMYHSASMISKSRDSILLAAIAKITGIAASDLKKNMSAVRLQLKNEVVDCYFHL